MFYAEASSPRTIEPHRARVTGLVESSFIGLLQRSVFLLSTLNGKEISVSLVAMVYN